MIYLIIKGRDVIVAQTAIQKTNYQLSQERTGGFLRAISQQSFL